MRALAPNAVTALALCTGLSGAWFAMQGRWENAVAAIVIAGVLDAMDGRIARMLKGESRFGAELDSLSDVIAFGATPALVLYMWVMQDMPRFGWTISVFFVLCAALRLARFNAQIDTDNQPHKSAGFNTGVPSPPGAALALLPMMIWFETGAEWVRDYRLLAPWLLLCAFLMVSNVATYSWSSIKIRRSLRFMALAAVSLFVATLVAAPWVALIGVGILYAGMLPFSMMSYARVKKSQRTIFEAT
ncbi:MAG: phosphatidylcholine/phosphatidylserine synthase [Sphingorhabdus sp.]|uniref:CDP-alcohol phosphatidyltransferase family protein n=1 Tax=Sphingorhabdus sp. TaxID=1902408 RepID=UPI00273F7D14|nr:phosphatidylcholine/phosphatidylserine synthase [Sphingorhabdus sp.]MDP4873459.1 phosphatidylcholine/phosphatidylserine synthase [Sphingorhabdus sp.]MDP4926105.1 phosphatidylcholine/phosphatidylserine synthase [Sphingorhabdus sp.]